MAPVLKPDSNREHPVVAWVGILAIFAAILLISWARVAVHGTGDLESALSDKPPEAVAARQKPSPEGDRSRQEKELDEAVAAGRWAGGFSP